MTTTSPAAKARLLPRFAAESDGRRAGGHAQHLVARAVEVMVGEDAVAPGAAPVVPREPPLEGGGEIALARQGTAIDQQRQGAVGNAAVVGKAVGLDVHAVPPVPTDQPTARAMAAWRADPWLRQRRAMG